MGWLDWITPGWRRSRQNGDPCPSCSAARDAQRVVFRCRRSSCQQPQLDLKVFFGISDENRLAEIKSRLGNRTVFQPRRAGYVDCCPVCRKPTYVQVCTNPDCLCDLPLIPPENTVVITGLGGAGRHVYAASFAQRIRMSLCRRESFQMSVSDANEDWRQYAGSMRDSPQGDSLRTDSEFLRSPFAQMEIRFWAWRNGKQNRSRMVNCPVFIPDFQSPIDMHCESILKHASSLMFLVDPLSVPQASEKVEPLGPDAALDQLVQKLKLDLNLSYRMKIPKDLAIVITKADLVFPNDHPLLSDLNTETPPYSPFLTDQTSVACRKWLLSQGMMALIMCAEQQFQAVRFFTASALGLPPQEQSHDGNDGRGRWAPRRVEAPFLWLFHRRGLL